MEEEAVSLKKTGVKTGRISAFVGIGLLVEAAVTAKFPLVIAAVPAGTITGTVATALYGAWDIVKRKWFKE